MKAKTIIKKSYSNSFKTTYISHNLDVDGICRRISIEVFETDLNTIRQLKNGSMRKEVQTVRTSTNTEIKAFNDILLKEKQDEERKIEKARLNAENERLLKVSCIDKDLIKKWNYSKKKIEEEFKNMAIKPYYELQYRDIVHIVFTKMFGDIEIEEVERYGYEYTIKLKDSCVSYLTHTKYGTCSECDTLKSALDCDRKNSIKLLMLLSLHLVQRARMQGADVNPRRHEYLQKIEMNQNRLFVYEEDKDKN